MSIIEKAIDRLQERDGAPSTDLPDSGSVIEEAANRELLNGVDAGGFADEDLPLGDPVKAPPTVQSGDAAGPSAPGGIEGAARESRLVRLEYSRLEDAAILTPYTERRKLAEEYRFIKRPLLRNAFGKQSGLLEHGNLIMVTSAMPGEGKTTVAINLAMSIAMEMERTVLLVDADVSRSDVTQRLGITARYGLIDLLVRTDITLPDVILRADLPKLAILPSGNEQLNVTELMASDMMRRLTEELADRYDDRVIIFDSPPLLAASGASVLATLMGQVVMVVEAEKTEQKQITEALAMLDKSQLVQLVLNKSLQEGGKDYYYGYYGN